VGKGYLKTRTITGNGTVPVAYAAITISDKNNNVIYNLTSDENGNAPEVSLVAPDRANSMNPLYSGPFFSRYNILVHADGLRPAIYEGVMIFDTVTSIQRIDLEPSTRPEQEPKRVKLGRNPLERQAEYEAAETQIVPMLLPDVIIQFGMRGENVRLMQQAINKLADSHPWILWRIEEDGIFGNETRNAVMAFQRLFSLTPDGQVDSKTWNRLMLESFDVDDHSEHSIQSASIADSHAAENNRLAQIMSALLVNKIFTRRFIW